MSTTVSYPGVYIQELPSGVHTITGVATSIAAFVGWTNQGPTTPQIVLSWADYARTFGGLIAGAPLGYAVSQFFANGGNQAYIIRLTDSTAAPATLTLSGGSSGGSSSGGSGSGSSSSGGSGGSGSGASGGSGSGGAASGGITFQAAAQGAVNLGAWGNNYGIVIKAQSGSTTRFSLQVVYNPNPGKTAATVVESFVNLSATSPDPQGRYVGDILKAQSNYVMVKANTLTGPPAATTVAAGNLVASSSNLSGGVDGAQLAPASPGGAFENALLDPTNGVGGVNQLVHVDLFNLLCVPGEVDPPTISTLESFCAAHRAFMIVDCASTDTVNSLQSNSGPNNDITGTAGANAAFYFPWINAPDPLNQGATGPFPPCGYVAGIYASTDGSRGVWKAPAGTATSLTGIIGPNIALNDADNGLLNPVAVNCIRNFSAYGTVVWGARTLQGNDEVGSQWKYVPVRRLALYIEESLYRGTQWAVFEPNDEPLWSALRLNIGSFMQTLFRQGAFQGQTPQDAYFVQCDNTTTTQSDINMGIVNVLVGFAPLLPAEFVVIQIQQMAGQTAS
ncbi:MAG: phage tail sheath subtilisin-like domain-containing protein [Terracidiphilus sp.]